MFVFDTVLIVYLSTFYIYSLFNFSLLYLLLRLVLIMPWSCAGYFYKVSLFVDVVYINENFSKNRSETEDNKTMALTFDS